MAGLNTDISQSSFNPACVSGRQHTAWGVSFRKAAKMSISPCNGRQVRLRARVVREVQVLFRYTLSGL